MPEPTLRELLVDHCWTQFQLYHWSPGGEGATLLLAGRIERVLVSPDRRATCHGDLEVRATGDAWENVTTNEPFEIPGPLNRVEHALTPKGRLMIVSADPGETAITFLFADGDDGAPETLPSFGPLAKLDLATLTIVLRSDIPPPSKPDLFEPMLDADELPF